MANDNLHVVVFPWLAFGHMLPFLELSKSLARRGHKISFISTPRNIQRLPTLPPEISIDFIPFQLPKVEGLPKTAEATSDIPPESVQYLKLAFDRLDQPFRKFIQEANPKPNWIIHDFAQHWLPHLAAEANVPTIYFSIFSPLLFAFLRPILPLTGDEETSAITPEQLTVLPSCTPFATKVALRLSHARLLLGNRLQPNASGISDIHRIRATVAGCKALAVRSCREMEHQWLALLAELYKKPAIPVGLLLPPMSQGDTEDDSQIMQWLDNQKARSVVYVAFGSEAVLSDVLVQELAYGLELSKVSFLWALRWPESSLPAGFEERTQGCGLVAKGWVPQLKILGHNSVGGFMTHSGRSSVIEGLHFGHPLVLLLVLLPTGIDHGLIARFLEEKGIGVEVAMNTEDGSFTRESVAEALKSIIKEVGESCRRKASEMRAAVADKCSQEKYVDEFIQYLITNKNTETA